MTEMQEYEAAEVPFVGTNPPYVVYRLYDHSGDLLYVGATVSWLSRRRQHSHTSPWWPQVDESRTHLTPALNADDAAVEEESAIRSLHPLHNRQGVTGDYVRYRGDLRSAEGPALPNLVAGGARYREAQAAADAAHIELVEAIRAAYAAGCSKTRIAEVAGVSRPTVYKALRGRGE